MRDELDGARPGPDHRDPLPPKVIRVIPASGVEAVALEPALEAGTGGLVKLSGGYDHGVGLPGAAVGASQRPPVGVVPLAAGDVDAGHDRPVDAVLARHRLQIAQDLVPGRAD